MDIVGEKVLLDDFEKNPRGNLVTINASIFCYYIQGKVLTDQKKMTFFFSVYTLRMVIPRHPSGRCIPQYGSVRKRST